MLFVLVYIFLDFTRDVRGFQPAAVSSSAAMVFFRSGAAFLGLVARVKKPWFLRGCWFRGGSGKEKSASWRPFNRDGRTYRQHSLNIGPMMGQHGANIGQHSQHERNMLPTLTSGRSSAGARLSGVSP